MLKTILCLSLLTTIIVNGQHEVSKTTGVKNNKSQKVTETNLNLSKRINSYPFNKASQIKIISYNLNSDGMTRVNL
jgi:signal recognition particle receptor subunit beta